MGRARSWMVRRRFRYAVMLPLQCAIVLLCVAVTTGAAMQVQQRQLRAATEERVLDVAWSLAELEQVQEAILASATIVADAAQELQPLADLIEGSSGVDYVVITDAAGVRLTHPSPAERGRPVSTDPAEVLAGRPFLGTETGTLGATLRAKVPVQVGGTVVGTVSVGVLESEIAADLRTSVTWLAPWVIGALLVGCSAAALVSHLVGRRVRRLEAAAAELGAQRRLTQALREQTHEFHTRIHAVYGLIENGEPQEAMAYIAELVPVSDSGAVLPDIADPRVRAVVASTAETLARAGGELTVDPLSSVARDTMDSGDLSVLANLLGNAVEATDGRGRLWLSLHADRERVELVVDDDGPGVDPHLLPRLFQHGVTTKSAAEGEPRGTGLALVRRVVRARDGEVEVGGSPAGGARFAVRMRSHASTRIARATGDRAVDDHATNEKAVSSRPGDRS